MYENILIPLDGSPEAARALPYAVSFARAFDATCTLLAVVPETSVPAKLEAVAVTTAAPATGTAEQPEYWLAAKAWLAEARDHLVADEWIQTSLLVRHGSPAETILDVAREGNFDLIVLTIFGRGAAAVSDWPPVIGSVADEVLRGTPVPVLVIRPNALKP